MKIGVPQEVKIHEYRVGCSPGSVRELVSHGHQVVVQVGAGIGAGFADDDYLRAGAEVVPDAAMVFGEAELIEGVKEPQPSGGADARTGQILFIYLHLAADRALTDALAAVGCSRCRKP